MIFFFIFVAFILILYFQGAPLIKKRQYRDLAIFTGFLSVSFTLALLQMLNFDLPNPTKGIEFLVKKVTSARFEFKGD